MSNNDCDCYECRENLEQTLIFDNQLCLKFIIVTISCLFLWYLNLLPHATIFLIVVNFVATLVKSLVLIVGIKEKNDSLIKYYLIASIISFVILFIGYLKMKF